VRSTYSAVRTASSHDRDVITARARLAASTLTCSGVRSGTAAGEGPVWLRIELVRRAGGYRIASQQTRR
jgi:hypothetical protein